MKVIKNITFIGLLIYFLPIAAVAGINEPQDKIYSVKEITEIFKSDPGFLKNKEIKLEACKADVAKGLGCGDYLVLVDYENVQVYSAQYASGLTEDERNKLWIKVKEMSIILSGESLSMPREIFPTYYAVYEGHFYDKSTKGCGVDGWKRFVIDKKIREITLKK